MATVNFWPNSRNTTNGQTDGHTDSWTNGQPTIDNAARQLFNCPKKKSLKSLKKKTQKNDFKTQNTRVKKKCLKKKVITYLVCRFQAEGSGGGRPQHLEIVDGALNLLFLILFHFFFCPDRP